jgi:uncharacterized 2Fe-2S/4Fe-4S cluster protein (DUF4445 family)
VYIDPHRSEANPTAERADPMAEQPKAIITLDTHPHAVPVGATVMEGLVGAGVLVRSDCGGKGRCGKCLIKATPAGVAGLSPAEEAERKALGEARAESGYRLACCARVTGDVALDIPDESRVAAEVVQKGLPMLFAALGPAPEPRPTGCGVAVDLGTTTIAVYLCDLAERTIIGSTSARNPQAIFGDDVVSRIGAVRGEPGMLPRLQKMAVSAIDWAVKALCRQARVSAGEIAEVVAVGNSTMVHLLLGESPASIGVFPYAPLFVEDRLLRAGDVGLAFNPSARLRTLPLISGYLGADIVSAAVAADLTSRPVGTLLADVGTNERSSSPPKRGWPRPPARPGRRSRARPSATGCRRLRGPSTPCASTRPPGLWSTPSSGAMAAPNGSHPGSAGRASSTPWPSSCRPG